MKMATKIREHLLRQRQELSERLEQIQATRWTGRQTPIVSEEPAARDAEVRAQVETATAANLVQTERALALLDFGLYGICEYCGARIEAERLEANPAATTCISCAIKHRSPTNGHAPRTSIVRH